MSCAKMAEPIEMPFCGLTPTGPRNHVLERVNIGRIHLQPGGVTSRRCDLSWKFFDHLYIGFSQTIILLTVLRSMVVTPGAKSAISDCILFIFTVQ